MWTMEEWIESAIEYARQLGAPRLRELEAQLDRDPDHAVTAASCGISPVAYVHGIGE